MATFGGVLRRADRDAVRSAGLVPAWLLPRSRYLRPPGAGVSLGFATEPAHNGASMPTVLRAEGFRFFFYSEEGSEPPHVHVERQKGRAKFWLRPVALESSRGLKIQELSRAEAIVIENQKVFEDRWNEHFAKNV